MTKKEMEKSIAYWYYTKYLPKKIAVKFKKGPKLFPVNIANDYIYSHGQVSWSIDLPEFDLEIFASIFAGQHAKRDAFFAKISACLLFKISAQLGDLC